MSLIIRREQQSDIQHIETVTIAAFKNAQYSAHNEQYIVNALRCNGALSVSLVAEHNGVVIGHVAVSPVTIAGNNENWFGLGPISVVPSEQGKGVGTLLMNAAIDALKTLKANGCVLLGEPAYYSRFGFSPINGLTLPGVPAEYFQALHLQGTIPQGDVVYNDAFSARK